MKILYKCDFCSYTGIDEDVRNHEMKCEQNPVNILEYKNKQKIMKSCHYHEYGFNGLTEYYPDDICTISTDDHLCNPRKDCIQYCEELSGKLKKEINENI